MVVVLSLALIESTPFADMVYLESGGEIEGVIQKETSEAVTIAINVGTITYSRQQIKSVSKSSNEENAKLKEKWKAQKEQKEKEQEEWRKFADEQEAKGLIFYNGQWITKDEYEKLTAPKIEEEKKAKNVVESTAILPPTNKKPSFRDPRYEGLLGKTTLKKLKKQSKQTYYLYLPTQYSSSDKWPLFIGIHAYTFDGRQAINFWKEFADAEGFILVCPNFPNGYQRLEGATDNRMIDIIEELKKDFRIDDKKVLMTGFSGGAQFAHRFVLRHPEYIQAVSIMAAGSYDRPTFSKKAKHIKFLVMAGAGDKDRLELSQKFATQLKNEGYDVEFKSFSGVDHWVCDGEKKITIQLFKELVNK